MECSEYGNLLVNKNVKKKKKKKNVAFNDDMQNNYIFMNISLHIV